MWTFQRVNDELGDLVLRDVIGELNNLICGYGPDERVNRSNIDSGIWTRLLQFGGMTEEGIALLLADSPISQCNTAGPFTPFTINTIYTCAEGESPLLPEHDADHVIRQILTCQGRLSDGE